MRLINFSAGPSRLPLPVLEVLRDAMVEYNDAGASILELSHRSPEVGEIVEDCQARITRLLNLPAGYRILFMTGGASMQFVNVPLNFLVKGTTAAYANTGSWSKKAIAEARRYGEVHIAASSEDDGFFHIPKLADFTMPANCRYLHITSNNTIYGTQYQDFPEVDVPLVADMSSDMLSRPIPVERFGLIYAGAQKNLGPAGVTLVIVREDMFEQMNDGVPNMQSYQVMAEKDSLYNTPPVFQILAVREVVRWLEELGGLEKMATMNQEKGDRLYGVLDNYSEFYNSPVAKDSRSLMNVTFRLPSEELEKKFIAEARDCGMMALKGHRSVGGIRVSMYNALLPEELGPLVDFMEQFAKNNG